MPAKTLPSDFWRRADVIKLRVRLRAAYRSRRLDEVRQLTEEIARLAR